MVVTVYNKFLEVVVQFWHGGVTKVNTNAAGLGAIPLLITCSEFV